MKIQYLIAIHLMRWLTDFYDFSFKWTATGGIGIHPTKAWLSQLVNFKNAIWTLEERYAIKLCFKLGKNATETYGMLQTVFRPSCMNRASVFQWRSSGDVAKFTDNTLISAVVQSYPWDQASSAWAVEYTDCISTDCPRYDIKQSNSKAPALEYWECRVSLYYHCSQTHCDQEWSYMIGSYLWVK